MPLHVEPADTTPVGERPRRRLNPISVRLPVSERLDLTRRAQADGVSRNKWIRRAVREKLYRAPTAPAASTRGAPAEQLAAALAELLARVVGELRRGSTKR